MKIEKFLGFSGVLFLLAILPLVVSAEVPQQINYQGYLTDDQGNPVTDDDYQMKFTIYNEFNAVLWSETQLAVPVTGGIYNVRIGQDPIGNPFSPDLFNGERFLGVKIGSDPEMIPKQRITSVAFAMRAENADMLEGKPSSDFSESGHGHVWWEISNRPSGLDDGDDVGIDEETDPTVEEWIKDGITWTEVSNRPSGLDDGDDVGIEVETDPTVPFSIKDGITWTEISSRPGGLDDGDDVGITGVTAGTGLTGGGSSGNVTVNLQIPIVLSGDHTHGIVQGTHAASSNFARLASAWEGVFGQADGGRGVVGWSDGNDGVLGKNIYSNNIGTLGSLTYGVYGNSSILAVYGENTNGNIGYLGGVGAGVYGEGTGNNFAGYFDGKVKIDGNLEIWNGSSIVMELGIGLDYAEGFNVSEKNEINPGSVLVIDPDNPGKLALSSAPYDRKVAGIVAGGKDLGSGIRLGAGQFDYDVALAGRVYCNVDATKIGVEPGDMLTTSSTAGYAMKSMDYARAHGAILGKAMQRLEKGKKGQILVLVTLQ